MSNKADMDRVWPIITNRDAIAVDHAWAGNPGMLYKTLHNETVEVWAKPLPQHKVSGPCRHLFRNIHYPIAAWMHLVAIVAIDVQRP